MNYKVTMGKETKERGISEGISQMEVEKNIRDKELKIQTQIQINLIP